MQQKNINLQSLPRNTPEMLLNLNQHIIQSEQTSGKNQTEIEYKSTAIQGLITSVIGDRRICSTLLLPRQTLRVGVFAPLVTKSSSANISRFEIDRVSTGKIDLVRIRWHEAFQLEQDPLNTRYVIYLVLTGSLAQKINHHQTCCCSPDTATIINPLQKLDSLSSEQGDVLLISIDRDSIEATLGKLLDRSLKQPAIFDSSIDLTKELGWSLKKFVQFLWEAVAEENLATTDFSALVLQKLEQAFLACAIEGLHSNYSEEILYQTDGTLAAHVRKAQAFIESHLDEDIKLRDIAIATGICPRLLQKAFSHHCDCSPMQFVSQARLEQIRSELTHATADTKIVDVMMRYQFTQSGKFAKQYQQLFGEKPSETLKR